MLSCVYSITITFIWMQSSNVFIHSLSWCINRLFKVLTLSSINYYAWKNIEFYFAQYYAYGNDSSHTAERSCWKRFFEHWIIFIVYCSSQFVMLDDASLDHVLLPLFPCPPNPPLLLSHQGPPVSIICTKCITHLWISLPLPPGHPSISHLCTFPWSPATAKNQATEHKLFPPL